VTVTHEESAVTELDSIETYCSVCKNGTVNFNLNHSPNPNANPNTNPTLT